MKGSRFVHWQEGRQWLGYREEFPDYLTQGESLEDLKQHLRDLQADLSGYEFIHALARFEVSPIQETPEELAEDLPLLPTKAPTPSSDSP
jgi:hypothetical protein